MTTQLTLHWSGLVQWLELNVKIPPSCDAKADSIFSINFCRNSPGVGRGRFAPS